MSSLAVFAEAIAPSMPPLAQVKSAMEVVTLCVLLASLKKLGA